MLHISGLLQKKLLERVAEDEPVDLFISRRLPCIAIHVGESGAVGCQDIKKQILRQYLISRYSA